MADPVNRLPTKAEATKAAEEAARAAEKAVADFNAALNEDAAATGMTAKLYRADEPRGTASAKPQVAAAAAPRAAAPKPVKAAFTTPTIDHAGGEVISGIAAVNYSINGEVFGSVPQFRESVKAGTITRDQHAAFTRGGNALIAQLPEEVSGQFSEYLSKLTIEVGKQAYPGRDYKGTAIYSGIAAQMDMWRTSGLTPEQISTKMFEPGSIRETVALVRLLEKPASSYPASIDPKPSPQFMAAMEGILDDGKSGPVDLVPAALRQQQPQRAAAPAPATAKAALAPATRSAGATDSVTRSLEAVFAADHRLSEFTKQFQTNTQLSGRFGVDQNGFGRADVDGTGELDKRDMYAILAPAVKMLQQGYSVADIAKQIGTPDYMEQAAQELSRTTGTRIATVGPDGYNHGGRGGGASR